MPSFFEGDCAAGAVNSKVALHVDALGCCVRHKNDGVARLRSGDGLIERRIGLLANFRHNASSGWVGGTARCRGCSVRRSAAFRCGRGCRWVAARCGNRGRSSAFTNRGRAGFAGTRSARFTGARFSRGRSRQILALNARSAFGRTGSCLPFRLRRGINGAGRSAFPRLHSGFDSGGRARTGCEFIGVRRRYRTWRNGKADGKNKPGYNNITMERA